jgi:fatty acid desaturase
MEKNPNVLSHPAGKLAPYAQPSVARWLGRAAIDWAIVIADLWAVRRWNHPIGYFLGMIVLATRQHAISILGHDGAHFAISKKRAINDTLASLVAMWPLGSGLDGYRKFHFLHHAVTGTDKDPELIHKRWAAPEWALPMTRGRMARYLAKDVLGLAIVDIYRVIRIVKPASLRDKLGPAIWWGCALLIMWRAGGLWIAAVWFGTMVSSFWAIFRLRMWTEHTGTSGTHRTSSRWWERAIFVPHNTWCHYEHHRWPSIPCWNLPRLRPLDTEVPVISIGELWRRYPQMPPMPFGIPEKGDTARRRRAA